ncbi:hypothetical protein KTT_19060 [Tengunoibacter tsumagoiensis]|uniref:Protein kinase domain-containing protein n=2 Tax=Tengunoibacter tsumagoiensis TaxID=2014871 RepID=A0A401ZYY8_9CHLR|nr:hypothetical protein KTT_19060 [Tengunoibacter tsumagoiensis]
MPFPHDSQQAFLPFPLFFLPIALTIWSFGKYMVLVVPKIALLLVVVLCMWAAQSVVPPHTSLLTFLFLLLIFLGEALLIFSLRTLFMRRRSGKHLISSSQRYFSQSLPLSPPLYINEETPIVEYVGKIFDDYRLLRLLGQGSFGKVYLGEHIRHHGPAAVKILYPGLLQGNYRRFIDEASTAFRLHHPAIVDLLGFGISPEGTPFLVMEYASNQTLRKRHPKGERLSLQTICSYLTEIAPALQYAHERRVIHRDIKPENILLGSQQQLLLSDFGLAVIIPPERSLMKLEVEGTVTYIAPEQIRGRPQPASDQYALAIMVYEWLSGSVPFTGGSLEIIQDHLSQTPPSLLMQRPSLPPTVEKVVFRALAKNPQERFPDVISFAHAFLAACQDASHTTNMNECFAYGSHKQRTNSIAGTVMLEEKSKTPQVHPYQTEPLPLQSSDQLPMEQTLKKPLRRQRIRRY